MELCILSIFIVEFLVNILGFILVKMFYFWFLRCIKVVVWLMKIFDRCCYFDVKVNLDFVFGDFKSEEEKKRIIKKGYENFVFIILEIIRVIFIFKVEYDVCFMFINEENVWKFLNKEG